MTAITAAYYANIRSRYGYADAAMRGCSDRIVATAPVGLKKSADEAISTSYQAPGGEAARTLDGMTTRDLGIENERDAQARAAELDAMLEQLRALVAAFRPYLDRMGHWAVREAVHDGGLLLAGGWPAHIAVVGRLDACRGIVRVLDRHKAYLPYFDVVARTP